MPLLYIVNMWHTICAVYIISKFMHSRAKYALSGYAKSPKTNHYGSVNFVKKYTPAFSTREITFLYAITP